MILPSSIHITKADEILPLPAIPAEGMDTAEGSSAVEQRVVSREAIVNKTDKVCATG